MTDTESSSTPYYCITQARCRLCQFKLEDDEPVVAAVGDDDRISVEFPFQRHSTFYDDELDIKLHMCLAGECMCRTKSTVCFHYGCYESRFYSVTLTFLAVTHYAFAPSVSEERRRARYIQQALSRNLQRAAVWPRELPSELWLMVAGLLVEPSAVLTAEEQVHRCNNTGDSVLDLTQPIYSSYVKMDGRYYVKSLQNTTGANTTNGTPHLVLPAPTSRGGEGKDMFVAEDYLGIRQVVFVSPKRCDEWCRNHLSVPGAWWRHISRKAIPSTVAIRSDGLKIRDIQTLQKEPLTPSSCVGWQVPLPSPPVGVVLLTLEIPTEYPSGLRMRYFDCNAPDIIGYSVATDGVRILDIISHKRDQKINSSLFEDVISPICHWIYMPINQGEYLTDICRRAGFLFVRTETVGMTFSTNQGRTVLFGIYGHGNVDLRRVATLSRSPCRVYFNQLDSLAGRHSVELMAFEQGGPTTSQDMLPNVPVSISNCPYTQSNEVWLHSSCTMLHVTEVHACIKKTAPHQPVMGMLLCYADGHRECVGQFRLDWVAKPIRIGEMDKMYIRGERIPEKNWAYVADVTTRAPVNQAEGRWLEVAQAGTLEWWFSSRHSVLYYNSIRLN